MKLFLILLSVAALLCCLSSAKNSSIVESVNNGNAEHSSEIQQDADNHGQIKFDELNADVLRIIFNFLDFWQIINLLEVSPAATISIAANDIFWQKYRHHEIHINFCYNMGSIVDTSSKSALIQADATELLEWFGGGLQRLNIDYTSDTAAGFYKRREKLRSSNSQRRLQRNHQLGDKSIARNFPRLKYLELITGTHNRKENVYELLRKNPQILSLTIENLSQHLSNIIVEHVPGLEHLIVASKFDLKKETCFEHVKLISFDQWYTNLTNVSLPSLETLEVVYRSLVISPELKESLNKHQNITKLQVQASYSDDALRLNAFLTLLSRELPNLIEITIDQSESRAYVIRQMIESNPKLKKIQWFRCDFPKEQVRDLRNDHGKDWNIDTVFGDYYVKQLLLERKN